MRRTLRAAALASVALVSLSIAAACSGGGGHSATATPTPPAAPQNVAATASYQSLHVTWDAVTGATGYKVYVSDAAFTTTAGLAGVFVLAPPFDATVTNWVTQHVRVAAQKDALASALSSEATATATAGFVVASHTSGATLSLDWFHADETDVMTDSIPNGKLLDAGLVGTTGAIYAIRNPTSGLYTEIGIANGAGHTAYAGTAGHTYKWAGQLAGTPSRVVLEDLSGVTATVRSYALAGGDERVLATGCTAIGPGYLINPHGILFDCENGAPRNLYSDGVSTGVVLNAATAGAGILPVGLSATRAFYQNNNTMLSMSQPFSSAAGAILPPGATTETILGVGSARVLVRFTNGANFGLFISDHDGTNGGSSVAASATDFAAKGVADDGSGVLVLSSTKQLLFVRLAIGSNNTDECPAFPTSVDRGQLLGGNKVMCRVPASGWFVNDLTTPAAGGILLTASSGTDVEIAGVQPGWVLLYKAGTFTLTAYSTTSSESHVLSTNAKNSPPIFRPDLTVVWMDRDNTTHLATTDATTIAPVQVDATAAYGLVDSGAGSNGRLYWSVFRGGVDWDVLLHEGTQTKIVAGAASSETGFFFEN